jgi:hypothetical protein
VQLTQTLQLNQLANINTHIKLILQMDLIIIQLLEQFYYQLDFNLVSIFKFDNKQLLIQTKLLGMFQKRIITLI